MRQGALGSYDNFNMVMEGARGNLAIGIELIYDTLLLPSMDEASSAYGLLAEAVTYPGDFSWVRYRLRPEARFPGESNVKVISRSPVISALTTCLWRVAG